MKQKQKLVTIFLHDRFEKQNGGYGDPKSNSLFGVSEHLENYLEDGWTIKEFQTMGGAGGCLSGWIVVLLEKAPY